MRGGRAVAELVLGHIEPFGRLPVSVPRHVGQQPTYYNQVRGQHGHRYADLTQDPQFVFGEGLTYTTVDWSDLTLDASEVAPDDVVTARVTVTNSGHRTAYEVVQAYVADLVTSVTWAARSSRRSAASRSRRRVGHDQRPVPVSACTIVDAAGRRVVEPGDFELRVGGSRACRPATGPITVLAPASTITS